MPKNKRIWTAVAVLAASVVIPIAVSAGVSNAATTAAVKPITQCSAPDAKGNYGCITDGPITGPWAPGVSQKLVPVPADKAAVSSQTFDPDSVTPASASSSSPLPALCAATSQGQLKKGTYVLNDQRFESCRTSQVGYAQHNFLGQVTAVTTMVNYVYSQVSDTNRADQVGWIGVRRISTTYGFDGDMSVLMHWACYGGNVCQNSSPATGPTISLNDGETAAESFHTTSTGSTIKSFYDRATVEIMDKSLGFHTSYAAGYTNGLTAWMRCDSDTSQMAGTTGCVDPKTLPVYTVSKAKYPQIYAGINEAFHLAGGQNKPDVLTRDMSLANQTRRRNQSCPTSWARYPGLYWTRAKVGYRYGVDQKDSCDEYPFANTTQGGNWDPLEHQGTLGNAHRQHVPIYSENSSEGGTRTGFLTRYRVLNGDPFKVALVP